MVRTQIGESSPYVNLQSQLALGNSSLCIWITIYRLMGGRIRLSSLKVQGDGTPSETTLDSVRNTQVFGRSQTALTEPYTLWWRITHFPSPRRLVALPTHLFYFAPGMW